MRWALAFAFVCLLGLAFVFGREEILVNVSPLARVVVNGDPRALNDSVSVSKRSPDVIADGFIDDQYRFETPTIDGRCLIELHFPRAIDFSRITLVGGTEPASGLLSISGSHGVEGEWRETDLRWSAAPGYPPICVLSYPGSASVLQFEFESKSPIVVSSIQCYSQTPRWAAWSWFVGLQIIAPWFSADFGPQAYWVAVDRFVASSAGVLAMTIRCTCPNSQKTCSSASWRWRRFPPLGCGCRTAFAITRWGGYFISPY